MIKITPKQLTVINLRYGNTAKSLKVLAYANLTAKALFLYGDTKSISEISRSVAKIINITAVSEKLIESGLKELVENKKIFIKENKWCLKKDTREEMINETEISDKKFDYTIEKHFPKTIKKEILKEWFNDAIVDFFECHGDEWVQTICKGSQKITKRINSFDEILLKSMGAHKLTAEKDALSNSFRCLLSSNEIEDQTFLMNIGFAMFSARLVAADVGADPIAIDELKNANLLIDTNILFPLHLEGHMLSSSFEALGKALVKIGASVKYIDETKDEYSRVWVAKRAETIKLFEVYPEEVIKGAEDDFIFTAISRGCKETEDFKRFFNSIIDLPKKFPEGPDLEILQDEKIENEIKKAKKDSDLKTSIQQWCMRLRPFWNRQPKSKSALDHDAALIYVAEFEKKQNNKTFILTLDRSLQACCAERAGAHEIPSAICLEGIIQILAANNAGPDFDATNFAPLMSSILIKKCIPPNRTYNIQDLHWLFNIQKNVAGFVPEKIQEIALEVTKARLAGKTPDDNNLQRTINRLYQEEIQKTDQRIKESYERAQRAEKIANEEKEKRLKLETELKIIKQAELIKKEKSKLTKTLLWRIPVTLIMGALAYFFTKKILEFNIFITNGLPDYKSLWELIISIITILGFGYKLIVKPIQTYKDNVKELINKK